MTPPATGRRALLAAAAVLAAPRLAVAEDPWPAKPVRYICPYAAGGPTDTLSRQFCQKMSEFSGQQFVVENRTGSGGVVGNQAIAQAAPDGYTIGMGGIATHAISPTLYARLPFDPHKDFTFVTGLWRLPNLLVVNNDLPVRSVAELIALLKANPGKYSFGSAGPGTTLHISGELFKMQAGVDMAHVPYRGSAAAYPDILAGRVHMIFDNIPGALAQAREGRVRPLGVTSLQRSPVVSDIPAISETLPGFDMTSWTCLCGPAGLSRAVVDRMSALSRRALESEDLKRQYLDQASTAWWTTPEQIADFRAAEETRLAPIIRASGARAE
ncbi:Bug family tripartite tricarboxylate transporter substrate binding protein [Neoroseomonas soli]|uniref:Tripartite tricarboxylate transporter substrate binding protein n=1 Tax=Neoroseomonas soli TaxID=1081025 RepID=A0A9X9X2L5_9PROT|nr:tripartite tricarboxylate transporter substrate binding protein [Neoroseomonas soli]MBR0673644.1 tripartite tricarboxylate transporter substrate binding protein [Neoroseomonas soli]